MEQQLWLHFVKMSFARQKKELELRNSPAKINKPTSSGSSNSTNWTRSVIGSHLRLLQEQKHCDVTFVVGPPRERIKCHQLFLKARSPVFEAMFSERWAEGSSEVNIPDVNPMTFRSYLEFIYADTFVATVSEALNLLYVAHKYEVELLVQKCESLLQSEVTLEDSVAVFQAARKYERAELMKKAGDIMAKSLDVLANDESFIDMDQPTLTYLLQRDDLRVKEVEIFKIAVKWGQNQVHMGAANGLNEALVGIIPLIRFPVMTLTQFTTAVVPTGLLPQDVLLNIFTYFGYPEAERKKLEKSLKFSAIPRAFRANGRISLYSGTSNSEYSTYNARDVVGFQVSITKKRGRAGNRSIASETTDGIAISGIVLLCPRKDTSVSRMHYSSRVGECEDFTLSVEQGNTHNRREYIFSYSQSPSNFTSNIKLEWGKEMQIKVEPPVPLRDGSNFSIILQEAKSGGNILYVCRDMSGFKSSAELELDSYTLKLQQLQRYHQRSAVDATANIIKEILIVKL